MPGNAVIKSYSHQTVPAHTPPPAVEGEEKASRFTFLYSPIGFYLTKPPPESTNPDPSFNDQATPPGWKRVEQGADGGGGKGRGRLYTLINFIIYPVPLSVPGRFMPPPSQRFSCTLAPSPGEEDPFRFLSASTRNSSHYARLDGI